MIETIQSVNPADCIKSGLPLISVLGSWENAMFKLMNWLLNAVIAIVVFLMAAALFNKFIGAPPWVAGVVLCVAGVGLYLGNVLLVRSYVIKLAPGLANDEMWEITAGTGIVPKWVSFLGLLSYPAFISAGIWFFEWYWPK